MCYIASQPKLEDKNMHGKFDQLEVKKMPHNINASLAADLQFEALVKSKTNTGPWSAATNEKLARLGIHPILMSKPSPTLENLEEDDEILGFKKNI
jgi:hypothetical protein